MKQPTMRVQDMTTGSPLRLILNFAVPLFIGNIFQQCYSMVDTMVVGYHLGDTGIAAIGATASLYSLSRSKFRMACIFVLDKRTIL